MRRPNSSVRAGVLAPNSVVGRTSHGGDLEAEAVAEVGIDGSIQDVVEALERSSPGGSGVLGRPSLRVQPCQ